MFGEDAFGEEPFGEFGEVAASSGGSGGAPGSGDDEDIVLGLDPLTPGTFIRPGDDTIPGTSGRVE